MFYCNVCGRELEDNEDQCPVCGAMFAGVDKDKLQTKWYEDDNYEDPAPENYELEEDPEEDVPVEPVPEREPEPWEVDKDYYKKKPDDEKTRKKRKRIITAVTIVLALAAVSGAGYYVPKILKYNKASAALDRGDIDNAVSIYTQLHDFRNSKTMVDGGAYYEYAESLYKDGDYENAAVYYEKAAKYDYRDSAKMARESHYNEATRLYESGNYEAASSEFENAGDISDAGEFLQSCAYEQGIAAYKEESFEEAINFFTEAGDYEDSADMLSRSYYKQAGVSYADGDLKTAHDDYMKSQYGDYLEKAGICYLEYAGRCYKNSEFDEAIRYYSQVDQTYKDTTDLLDACYQAKGKKLLEENDYNGAIETFAQVKNIDVTSYINNAKAAYVADHMSADDETTLSYLCDLKYASYGTAAEDLMKLTGWNIQSFINGSTEDYSTRNNSCVVGTDAYVHSVFNAEDGKSSDIVEYIVHEDGSKSKDVVPDTAVKTGSATWVLVTGESQKPERITLYVRDKKTNMLLDKYTFEIREK